MTTRQIAKESFDNDLRAERVHWLGCQADQYSDELKEVFETLSERPVARVNSMFTAGAGRKIKLAKSSFSDLEEFMGDTFHEGLHGMLVEISAPCPTGMTGRFMQTCGFGFYTTEIFYTEALDAAFFAQVLKWKEGYIEKEKARLLSENVNA